jgi:flagellar hook-associated protein 1
MADILGIGTSALLTSRTALDVAGHNIANANTPGYSRQRVDLAARLAGLSANGFSGTGVQINSVQRLDDQFVFAQEVRSTAAVSRTATFQAVAQRTDSLLSDASTGLGSVLNGFFDSLAGLAANPSSGAVRQTVLTAAESLASRFQDLQRELDDSEQIINAQLRQTVTEINGYAHSIAQLNSRIADALGGSGGQPPNDLLDQRDQLVRALSERVSVSTVPQDDGALNVFVANGQSLVVGTQANVLETSRNEFNAQRLEISTAGNGAVISSQLGGGRLGGLLDARREVLDPAREKLGRIALALTDAVNRQQAMGVDQTGALGAPLFTPVSAAATASVRNTGNAQLGVAIADAGQLSGRDYLLSFSGSSWSLRDARSGNELVLSGSGTAADPFRAEGLSIAISGSPAAGDRYAIQPGQRAAGQMQLALQSASQLAAAAPVHADAALANVGNGRISGGSVQNVDDPALRTPASIVFTSASSFSINGSGSYAYAPGSAINFNGWSVTIDGTPATGDRFDIAPTAANSGDARNAQQLSQLVSKAVLDGGLNSVVAAHAQLVEQVGSQSQQAGLQLQSQTALQSQTEQARNALSGVNLDEEAADLLRYQQAYQAAAQIIATAGTVFDTLLSAIRR